MLWPGGLLPVMPSYRYATELAAELQLENNRRGGGESIRTACSKTIRSLIINP